MGHDTVETPDLSFGRHGEPGRGTPYARYVCLDELHSLQRPQSKEPAELSFIITTQVMELLFDLLRHEWTLAQRALREDDLPAALAALRRGTQAQDVLVKSWDLLATMTPQEFNAFRSAFGQASGFQSSAFLHLEFLLGNKNAALLTMYDGMPQTQAELAEALRSPACTTTHWPCWPAAACRCARSRPSSATAPTRRSPRPGAWSTPTRSTPPCSRSARRCWTSPSGSPTGASATCPRSSGPWAASPARAAPAA